jgi:hypothetical protein
MADIRPVRLQLSRKKGFNLQALSLATNGLPAVVVSRPTKWGNPHDWRDWRENAPRDVIWSASEVDQWCREQCAAMFDEDLSDGTIKLPVEELRGLNVACWCSTYMRFACHGDYLLQRANRPTCEAA